MYVRTQTQFLFFERQPVNIHSSCVAPTSQLTLETPNTRGKPILGQTLEKSQYIFAIKGISYIRDTMQDRVPYIQTLGRSAVEAGEMRRRALGIKRAKLGAPALGLHEYFDCMVRDSCESPLHTSACRRATNPLA